MALLANRRHTFRAPKIAPRLFLTRPFWAQLVRGARAGRCRRLRTVCQLLESAWVGRHGRTVVAPRRLPVAQHNVLLRRGRGLRPAALHRLTLAILLKHNERRQLQRLEHSREHRSTHCLPGRPSVAQVDPAAPAHFDRCHCELAQRIDCVAAALVRFDGCESLQRLCSFPALRVHFARRPGAAKVSADRFHSDALDQAQDRLEGALPRPVGLARRAERLEACERGGGRGARQGVGEVYRRGASRVRPLPSRH
eukprot:2135089-Prymnesium_polylepis.1